MSDFFDRYGAQLRAVQATPATGTTRRNMLARAPRRGVLAGIAALVVAAPALAITQPWNPDIGRPGIDRPVSTDGSDVTAAARDRLAVLRRGQVAEDREKATPLLKGVVGDTVEGVQLSGVRALRDTWALVPAKTVHTGPAETKSDQLCFTDGQEITCGGAASLSTAGIGGVTASPTDGTTYTGLVPDGVTQVRFTPASGVPTTVDVSSNFYELNIPRLAPERLIDAPAGYKGPAKIPGPPLPVSGSLQWLDPAGAVVGPAVRNR
jgi:hypothetical protein